jgi:3-methyladenine DNA glycosylase AlkC
MAEPFKNVFNTELILAMAEQFHQQWSDFNNKAFCDTASEGLHALELKQRSEQIMHAMVKYLPNDFAKAGGIILASLSPAREGDIFGISTDKQGIAGWAIMPITHYIGLYGQKHFDLSMTLLKECTKRFSSEFGIRFFLLKHPEKTLLTMKEWAKDANRHVRRLASEGSRPRLPWAMQLPAFIDDPSPVIEILEILKDDHEEYVRRSVANNLNDIAKDHPKLVTKIAEHWMYEASTERKKLIRHACRTLLKQGNSQVLQVFAYNQPKLKQMKIQVETPEVIFGTALQFNISIASNAKHEQALMIDYVIHHQKANGKTSPKVFKWRIKTLVANGTLKLTKKHMMKKITTRKYYQGLHTLEIMVNGVSIGKADFELLIT